MEPSIWLTVSNDHLSGPIRVFYGPDRVLYFRADDVDDVAGFSGPFRRRFVACKSVRDVFDDRLLPNLNVGDLDIRIMDWNDVKASFRPDYEVLVYLTELFFGGDSRVTLLSLTGRPDLEEVKIDVFLGMPHHPRSMKDFLHRFYHETMRLYCLWDKSRYPRFDLTELD